MVAVIVLTGCSHENTILGELPVIINTAMVSPTTLPSPSKTAAIIPEEAVGTTVLMVVSHFVAPSARDACLNLFGTAFIASSEIEIMVGSAINASIMDPLNAVRPILSPNTSFTIGTIVLSPIKPITTEGRVARTSIIGLTVSLKNLGASSPI